MFHLHHSALAFSLILAPCLLVAQAETTKAPPSAQDAWQGAFRAEEQRRAAEIWKTLAEQDPENATAQYNYFVSTRNTSLARNNGSLPDEEKGKLKMIADDLDRKAPRSFEAHMARFHLQFPERSAFGALGAASAIDPARVELLGPQLARALMDSDDAAVRKWTDEIDKRGGISPALMDVAADLLLSVDADGIVITNGEMDTYPTLVKQRTFGLRRDVLVIDQRLLVDAPYRRSCWARARAAGSPPGAGPDFVRGLLNATTRPVFLALSLDPIWARELNDELYATGIALRYSHARVENIKALETRWSGMHKNMYAGPLTVNYLLPGSVLLRHYRTVGNETKAARLEHELRAIAEVVHATKKLYQLGVIAH